MHVGRLVVVDAWEMLQSQSTLNDGDTWEHLNNQAGNVVVQSPIAYRVRLAVIKHGASMAKLLASGEFDALKPSTTIETIHATANAHELS